MQAYEDDLCPGCGTPRTYGMDDDAAHLFDDHTATCHACAAKQEAEGREKKPPPGTYHYVTPNKWMSDAMHHPIHVNPFHR